MKWGRIANGYKTFERGNFRLQLYYPHIRIEKGEFYIHCDICCRLAWRKPGRDFIYRAFGFVCIFGIGFDHEVPNPDKEAPEST